MEEQLIPVNLSSAMLRCNLFNFFYSASKSSLIPFLTLFLRILGFSGKQVGFIIGAKTLSSFLFAPLLASIVIRLRVRRVGLMLSIFLMAVMYLSLTFVPYSEVDGKFVTCKHNEHKTLPNSPSPSFVSSSSHPSTTLSYTGSQLSTTPPSVLSNKSSENHSTPAHPHGASIATVKSVTESSADTEKQKLAIKTFLGIMKSNGLDEKTIIQKTPDELYNYLVKTFPKTKTMLTKDDVEKLLNALKNKPRQRRSINVTPTSISNVTVEVSTDDSWLSILLKNLKNPIKQMSDMKNKFMIVLCILVIGELFCSPVEKIADDCWFDFLETIDNIEKYGRQRIWGSFAAMICPLVVGLFVDSTHCLFGLNIDHFMIHFYAFGGALGITFLLAFFYPSPKNEKQKYVNKVWQGFRIVCCNCRGFLYVITLLIMGIVYASFHNFLFWVIQDLNGKEITMGMCITIATLSELPMLLFGDKLVERFGNSGVICLALVFLSVRVLYYSFLWTPWAVLLVEPLHAFTHTAMWWAVLSFKQFNIAPSVDRSIRSIMSSIYFGVGYSCGSFISGFVYDLYGFPILYRGAAILSFAWFPIFGILQKCLPAGPKIKYERLLNQDDLYSDSDTQEDDWLETAMNHK